MKTDLVKLKGDWKSLVLQGSLQKATALFWEQLFPLVQQKFVAEVQEQIKSGKLPQYDLLVLPIGLESHYYPMLINALKPKQVYFLCTKQGEQTLGTIIQMANLSPVDYKKDVIEYVDMDLAEVYAKIKERMEMFKGKKIAVDLTSGKRVMSAGAAIVGDFFGCDLVYIDENWVDEIKRGEPGTERLVRVKNPLHIFGDLENRYAASLFNQHEYVGAAKLFGRLRELSTSKEREIKFLLSTGYALWDAMNFKQAFEVLNDAYQKSKVYNVQIGDIQQLEKNIETLGILSQIGSMSKRELLQNNAVMMHLLAYIFSSAIRKVDQNQFDSLLRFLRMLDLATNHRLAKIGIDSKNPNYTLLNGIEQKYKETTKNILDCEKNLPTELNLVDRYIILSAINDSLVSGKTREELISFVDMAELRDEIIISHGTKFVDTNTMSKFRATAKEILSKLCTIYGEDFDKILDAHTSMKL